MSWRNIPAAMIDWEKNPISSRAGNWVRWSCSDEWKTSRWNFERDKTPVPGGRGYWCEMTLGQIADNGERWWIRNGTHIGPKGCQVIRWIIDEAAEGRCPMIGGKGAPAVDAYVPKCERGG